MKIEELRDELLSILDEHRAICTDANCAEPDNTIAFLCHCVGIRSHDMEKVRLYLVSYEKDCSNCQHRRK